MMRYPTQINDLTLWLRYDYDHHATHQKNEIGPFWQGILDGYAIESVAENLAAVGVLCDLQLNKPAFFNLFEPIGNSFLQR